MLFLSYGKTKTTASFGFELTRKHRKTSDFLYLFTGEQSPWHSTISDRTSPLYIQKRGQEEAKRGGIDKLKLELSALRKPSRALENNIARRKVGSC